LKKIGKVARSKRELAHLFFLCGKEKGVLRQLASKPRTLRRMKVARSGSSRGDQAHTGGGAHTEDFALLKKGKVKQVRELVRGERTVKWQSCGKGGGEKGS